MTLENIKNTTIIILASGSSSRFKDGNFSTAKQWLRIDFKPLWLKLALIFDEFMNGTKIIITLKKEELRIAKKLINQEMQKNKNLKIEVIAGGDSRQESLINALTLVDTELALVNDCARYGVNKEILENLFANIKDYDCVLPAIALKDTIIARESVKYLNREDYLLVQTPQLSKSEILKGALNFAMEQNIIYTDESSAIGAFAMANGKAQKNKIISGSHLLEKLTNASDIVNLNKVFKLDDKIKTKTKIGSGFDTHKLEISSTTGVILCGIEIDSKYKFIAHSDGDVAIHSIIDALLGAVGGGDIGEYFSDKDEKYKGISSVLLLNDINDLITSIGYQIQNISLTIVSDAVRLSPYKEAMEENLSRLLCIDIENINIAATTNEGLGYIGKNEGISVISTATLSLKSL